MMNLDMYWMTNDDWHEIIQKENGKLDDRIKDSAPPEAKESYRHYIEQVTRAAAMKTGPDCHII